MLIEALVTVLVGLSIFIGVLLVFLPPVPDTLIIWLAALAYGLVIGWGRSGPWLFGLITLLGLLSVFAELLTSSVGVKKGGASLWSVMGGVVLAVAGFIFLGPLGGLAGLLLGTYLVQYLRDQDHSKAWRATLGLGLGYGASFGLKLILALAMAASWLAWVFIG